MEIVSYIDTEILMRTPIADIIAFEEEVKKLDNLKDQGVGVKGFISFGSEVNNRYCGTIEVIEKTDKYVKVALTQLSDSLCTIREEF